MSKIYLPHADQFDTMNKHLANIASVLGADTDITTWAGIQKAVRMGVAPNLIPAGTQLVVKHSKYGEKLYDVVAHNYFKSAHDKNANTMTLLSHDALATMQFDAPEAFYYADAELPAGTYNFTLATTYSSWAAGTYQFTLKQALPKGGQLGISGNAEAAMTTRLVTAHSSRTDSGTRESAEISLGNAGTSLGTLGVELNHPHRVSYGSNNYKESAIRQFLNSSNDDTSVWSPQTKFDRPPSWHGSLEGFVRGFDEDFLSVVGEVIVPCAANNIYESPDSTTAKGEKYNVTDKFYLASQTEIFGTTTSIVADNTVLFPYYGGATNTDRIKYSTHLSAVHWWLRSNDPWGALHLRMVNSDGSNGSNLAHNANGVVPLCTIV